MAIRFHNTMTRRKEEFLPIKGSDVGLYTCGPTVYDHAHIGNFRTYLFEDLLRRYLKYSGYKVTQVMNITDVDDKTIRGCRAQGVGLSEYTEKYTKAFFEDLDALGIERAEHYPHATLCIDEMIEIVSGLVRKGYGYKSDDGSVYYNISKFEDYGRLAHINVDELRTGTRVTQDEYTKDAAADFALWKAWDEEDGDVGWDSPFGRGRPGWHIECSAMSRKHLGDSFDIHTGGVDNIFPHHQNEIAQSEAFTGKRFVRYWLHSEHLIVEGKKMSKSFGNFYTLRDLLEKGFTGREIRYLLLNTHYRQQLNFTFEGLSAARNSLRRIDDFVARVQEADGEPTVGSVAQLIAGTEKEFVESLDDDLNISAATGCFFDFIRDVNRLMDDGKVDRSEAGQINDFLRKLNTVYNLVQWPEYKEAERPDESKWQVPEDAPQGTIDLLNERDLARAGRDFARADEIRNRLTEMGYVIEDKKVGGRLKKR